MYNETSTDILRNSFQMMANFFEMHRDQERMVQEAVYLQNKLIATALDLPLSSPPLQPDTGSLQHHSMLTGTAVPHPRPSVNAPVSSPGPVEDASPAGSVKRLILKPVVETHTGAAAHLTLPPGSAVLILGSRSLAGRHWQKIFKEFSHPVYHVVPGKRTEKIGADIFAVDTFSTESIERLKSLIRESVSGIGGIINVADQDWHKKPQSSLVSASEKETELFQKNDEHLEISKNLFLFLKVFLTDLKESARKHDAFLLNVSFMDGTFGLEKKYPFTLGQAGCVGLVKSLARECPSLFVKCIDVDPIVDENRVIDCIKHILRSDGGSLEMGLGINDKYSLSLVQKFTRPVVEHAPLLDSKSVILATGGAYGIVSEILKEITLRYGSRVVILGRSPLSEKEPIETQSLSTIQELQDFFIKKMKKEKDTVSLADVMKQAKKVLKARQIRRNLGEISCHADAVEYHAMDVRDKDAFGILIDDIYHRWGRIDGVIHGSGVIEDKLIEMKSPEAFCRVFNTKVTPAMVLQEKLHPDTLKFLVFFSSIAARFGNRGQTDYAAANEILNKLADRLDQKWPTRVVSINWGPWNHGMISGEMAKLLSERGINMISVEEGVDMFFKELESFDKPASEVVISGNISMF